MLKFVFQLFSSIEKQDINEQLVDAVSYFKVEKVKHCLENRADSNYYIKPYIEETDDPALSDL